MFTRTLIRALGRAAGGSKLIKNHSDTSALHHAAVANTPPM
jgi:hypothetical protein